MPDGCYFCPRDATLTKEHILSGWMTEDMVRRDPSLTFLTIGKHAPEGYGGRRMDIAPRVACAPCNNGWMERLDSEARTFFPRMMRGQPQTLSIRRQTIVAAWATLKVMAAEGLRTSDREPYFTQVERRRFRRTRTPPPSVVVWLGRAMDGGAGWAEDRDIRYIGDDDTVTRAYAVLLQADQLVVLFFAHRFRIGGRFDKVSLPVVSGDAVERVWPSKGQARWPPPVPFGGEPTIKAWFDWWLSDEAMPDVQVAEGYPPWDQSGDQG